MKKILKTTMVVFGVQFFTFKPAESFELQNWSKVKVNATNSIHTSWVNAGDTLFIPQSKIPGAPKRDICVMQTVITNNLAKNKKEYSTGPNSGMQCCCSDGQEDARMRVTGVTAKFQPNLEGKATYTPIVKCVVGNKGTCD